MCKPRCKSSFRISSPFVPKRRLMEARIRLALWLALTIAWIVPARLQAEEPPVAHSLLTVDRIYGDKEFDAKDYSARWLEEGEAFTTLEESSQLEGRHDIVRHDAATGQTEVLVAAGDLVPPGEEQPLRIHDYAWANELNRVLIYTNTRRVWRQNTRGDYWVLDRVTHQLRKLGGDAEPSSLMFAKWSPDGKQVAYVRQRNIYVEDLTGGPIRKLTQADSDDVINGTTDWVYEEEFGLRDGFRWSPDGRSIAYWQINTRGVGRFPLVNQIDSLYPEVTWFAYPKVGEQNPTCRVGIVNCDSAETRWVTFSDDKSDTYIPRMEWAESSDELLLQRLNRLQNRNTLYLARLDDGLATPILTEQDACWVDVHDELFWISGGRQFTWISERDGWRHLYLASRSGGELQQVTSGKFDVIELLHVDEQDDWAYFIASPEDAAQRFLFRIRLDGSGMQRVTPATLTGTHDYQIAPRAKWAIHRASSADSPPVSSLIRLPDHSSERLLQGNTQLSDKLKKLALAPTEFFRVDIGDGVELDGWCIRPPNFDPSQSYPLLIYVYGEPAGSTVVDRWGGSSYLWHQMLAQRGYFVMSFDNRGTKVPRGREWRKSIYHKIGILPPQDQAAALKTVLEQRPYLDAKRVGIWGWSGGGSSSLQAIFKYPDLYQMAIAIAPVPDQRYYDTIYQERYMGLPSEQAEAFRQGSPINFAGNLQGKLLLVHGTADDNCHYQTTEKLVDELIAHNKQFRLMAYPNRTHAIRERANTTRHLRHLMADFVFENLPQPKAPCD